MAVDPRLSEAVMDAAVLNAGEIRRHYPHTDSDFRTDVSAMLIAAMEVMTLEFLGRMVP